MATIQPILRPVTPMVTDWVMAVSISVSSMKTPHFGAITLSRWNIFVTMQQDKQRMQLISAFPAATGGLIQQISIVMATGCLTAGKFTIAAGLVHHLLAAIIGRSTRIGPKMQTGMQTGMD